MNMGEWESGKTTDYSRGHICCGLRWDAGLTPFFEGCYWAVRVVLGVGRVD
jgi:hypothetical protein